MPIMVWPAALIVFVAFFFWRYAKDIQSSKWNTASARKQSSSKRQTSTKKQASPHKQASLKRQASTRKQPAQPERPRLSFIGRAGRMSKRDYLLALAITVAYAALAFAFSGSTAAPQTFWRATQDQPAIELDLGEQVQLDNVVYYTGLGDGYWIFETSPDGLDWTIHPQMTHNWWEVFRWKIPYLDEERLPSTHYIRITYSDNSGAAPEDIGMELGELALVALSENGKRSLMDVAPLAARHPQYAALFDEQTLVPDLPDVDNNTMVMQLFSIETTTGTVSDKDTSMIFDEFYHARTAYDYIRNLPPMETTHPPLGKAIISLGIRAFGMTPFGWRFMGILFGVFMVPLIYALAKNLFDNTAVAACGAILLAFENMHYSQTHLATIDSFVVLFILLMYLFMYRYISSGYDAPFMKTLPSLALCGLSFGLGVATKWTAFFAAFGLIALYAAYLAKRGRHQAAAGQGKEFQAFLRLTLAASAAFFVVIPFAVYTLCYIPYTAANGQALSAGRLFKDMWDNQVRMLGYHGSAMVDASHQFESRWWQWLLDIRPILYYSRFSETGRTVFGAFANPLVTVGGLASIAIAAYDFMRKRAKEALFIVVGYLAQLLPWVFVRRTTFAYHYFPSVMFLTLAICYVFKNMLDRRPERKWLVYAFAGVSAAFFFMLLPPTAGIQMPNWYSAWFVRWLPTWVPF